MYLLDTDVLSALRRRERDPAVARWLEAQRTTDLYLSVVTVGEVERGIERQRRRDPAFAEALAAWLDRVLAWYGDRVLGVDLPTAREHGLTVVTGNARHFAPTGVAVLNPFAGSGTS